MALKNTEAQLKQGDIWLFDSDPKIGKKIRPCVIVSNDEWNKIRSGLVILVPLTSVKKGFLHMFELIRQKRD